MSATDTPDVPKSTTATFTTTGRVKWFNNKAGYGFITVTAGEHNGVDVFVHHSAIKVEQEQYRYLVQGEYVNFNMCEVSDEKHNWQAGDVKGLHGGKLMCETRLESRENRTSFVNDNAEQKSNLSRPRTRGPGPRDGDEWMLVRRKTTGRYNQTDSRDTLRTRAPRR